MFPLVTKTYTYDFHDGDRFVAVNSEGAVLTIAYSYTKENAIDYLRSAGVLTPSGRLRKAHRPDPPLDIVIIPYTKYSRGARNLSASLEGAGRKSAAEVNSIFSTDAHPRPRLIINWGSSASLTPSVSTPVLNPPHIVSISSDKVDFFSKVQGLVNIPEFTTDLGEALAWVESGVDVLGRKRRGSCGTDIVTFNDNPVDFTDRDFWVKYKKKKAEYRIHIVRGKIISEQQKVLRSVNIDGTPIDRNLVDFRIRNHRNGFIFQRNNLSVPETVREQALLAVETVGLDFGAVDVIYNEYENKGYVLEINTAPGLEGTTLQDYQKAFGELLA